MKLTLFGEKLKSKSGISLLMDDLGHAMNVNRDILMLGGGNPALIPDLQKIFRRSMNELMAHGDSFERALGVYDSPQGNIAFIEALCSLMNKEYGWNIAPENVALTAGSQSAFFVLFNMFAGVAADGSQKKVLLPLAPEYIGYADIGIGGNIFRSFMPDVEMMPDRIFKYHVNFDRLKVTDDIGAICISRPTNPTGNVLTDQEVSRLIALAQQHDIPLILDNAYGTPFPNIIFTEAQPFWAKNVIVSMSLSKFGLPGTRTGIVIADKEVIQAVSEFNAVLSLAPNAMGAAVARSLVSSGEVLDISKNIIRPYYLEKCQRAVQLIHENFTGIDYYIHKPEGALFLWLWFKGLPISCELLYQRLKQRGVLVVPGHYFFPGMDQDWDHKDQCIRMTYSQDDTAVAKAIEIIADEVRSLTEIPQSQSK